MLRLFFYDIEITGMEEIKSWQEDIRSGWARHPFWAYSRHHSSYERDLYVITSNKEDWTVCASIRELGNSAEYLITYFDRKSGKLLQKRLQRHHIKSHRDLPESSDSQQDTNFSCHEMRLSFIRKDELRNILVSAPELEYFDARFSLIQPDELESRCTMTTWKDNRSAFFFDRKLNCMRTSGTLRLGDDTSHLSDEDEVFASLNIIRGRLPHKASGKWLTLCFSEGGHTIGLDIVPNGESTIVYDNILQRICTVTEADDKGHLHSSDKRLDIRFTVTEGQTESTGLLFGYCTGKVVLDDGTEVAIKSIPASMEIRRD